MRLGARTAVRQSVIALEGFLPGVLGNFNLKAGAGSPSSARIRELVRANAMPEAAETRLLARQPAPRVDGSGRRVRLLGQDNPVCRVLMTMSGVGAGGRRVPQQ